MSGVSLTRNTMVTGVLASIEVGVTLLDPTRTLWEIESEKPEIRQIYGHFLAPQLLEAAKSGLVAKDFNFPSAYHAVTGRSLEAVLEDIKNLEPTSTVRLAEGVHIRDDNEGCTIYTPHYNGYYTNELGRMVLESVSNLSSLSCLAEHISLDIDEIKDFIAELMVLGIVNVDHA